MQVYRFEKADVPEDEEELDTFVEALMGPTLVIQCQS